MMDNQEKCANSKNVQIHTILLLNFFLASILFKINALFIIFDENTVIN